MSITALKKDMDAAIERRSNVFVFTHSDSAAPTRANANGAYIIGEVRDAMLKFTAKKTSKSTTGKTKMLGADVEATFILMQTSDVEFAALDDLIAENDFGTTFKFSNGPCATSAGLTTPGFILENCGVSFDGEIKFDGSESGITFTLSGYCSVADLAGLGAVQGGSYASGERKLQSCC